MTSLMFKGTIELGIIYGILTLGLYLSFRILDLPDLTIDGSFVTGAAVSSIMCQYHFPFLALPVSLLAGWITGSITALLHTKLKIQMLLAGILSMMGLYSINLKIMGGKPNLPLLNHPTIFTFFRNHLGKDSGVLVLISSITLICLIILYLFLNTKLGFALRATGNNEFMARAQGIHTDSAKVIGLALSNSMVALSGAILAQYQAYSDIGMGVGMIVVGLASIIIGEMLLRFHSLFARLAVVVLGSILYRFILAFSIQMGLPPTDLKLVTATIVTVALSLPSLKSYFAYMKRKFTSAGWRRGVKPDVES